MSVPITGRNWGQMKISKMDIHLIPACCNRLFETEVTMKKFRALLMLATVAGLTIMTSSCAGEVKLGDHRLTESFEDVDAIKLVEAAWRGEAGEVERLVEGGVDVNTVGEGGVTPLMWALQSKNLVGVEALLKAGADPNLYVAAVGLPAINFVAGGDEPEMLDLLLRYGGDPNNPGGGRISERPLSLAAMQGRMRNASSLLAAGADLNAHDQYKRSAATQTLGPAHFELLAYFLEQGYSYDLEGLARGVTIRSVPEDSKAQRWKLQVLEMLRAQGVNMPELRR